jgi:hypothetical protein
MGKVYSTWGIHVPTDWLVWLTTSSIRMPFYRLQWLHGEMRLLHILSMAVFFGTILVLDLRLLGRAHDLCSCSTPSRWPVIPGSCPSWR